MSEQMASDGPQAGADGPSRADDPGATLDPADGTDQAELAGAVVAATGAGGAAPSRAPGGLRLARGVAGVVLLVLAWGALMAGVLLSLNTLGVPPHRHVIVRIALYVVGAVGVCWLGVVALAALVAGAFCLTMAFTRRGW